jgi:hypothetical protein
MYLNRVCHRVALHSKPALYTGLWQQAHVQCCLLRHCTSAGRRNILPAVHMLTMLGVFCCLLAGAGRAWRMGQRREVVVKRLFVKVRYLVLSSQLGVVTWISGCWVVWPGWDVVMRGSYYHACRALDELA